MSSIKKGNFGTQLYDLKEAQLEESYRDLNKLLTLKKKLNSVGTVNDQQNGDTNKHLSIFEDSRESNELKPQVKSEATNTSEITESQDRGTHANSQQSIQSNNLA